MLATVGKWLAAGTILESNMENEDWIAEPSQHMAA